MILYPTETLYALGVNALDPAELAKLYALKERDATKVSSWLVRSIEDIARYAEVGETIEQLIRTFMPGPLTLVLTTLPHVPRACVAPDGTIGFRISSDPVAQAIIDAFMTEYDAPLTCTSANVSGVSTYSVPSEILQQFGERANMIDEIHDDGPRKGLASTVVRVLDSEVSIIREGAVSAVDIAHALKEYRL